MKNFNFILLFERQLFASILLIYHILIWSPSAGTLQLGLMLVLYGLFLLWQPVLNKQSPTNKLLAVTIVISVAFISYSYPHESFVFFGLVLSGLIGSRLFGQPNFRTFDLLGLLIVILEMVTGVIPKAFTQVTLPGAFADYMQVIILIPILLFFFASNPDKKAQTRNQVDLMHGLLTSTLIFTVLLGAIVINLLYGVDYIDGFLLNVFLVSTLILGISWFWNPGIGYSGIGVLWNRYAMTIGGPFETWINKLTTLIGEQYLTPKEYLQASCEHLVENDWLNAIEWNLGHKKVSAGNKQGSLLEYQVSDDIRVELYFKSDPGKALEQHTTLLIRMAYQFYLAKLNQEKIRDQAHFVTIHHTGARLTHDIKNILQSIKISLDILGLNDTEKQPVLLKSNLTQISTRLETTLGKLKALTLDTQIKLSDTNEWFDKLEQQHRSISNIQFDREVSDQTPLPVDLFDSVAENLISNAIQKPSTNTIEVRLHVNADIVLLSVCDDGKPIEPNIEDSLFNQPVSSGSGMGIGLFQSAIMARAFNFELQLSQNEPGRVCFNLFRHLQD